MDTAIQTIVITGAGRGIGRALAIFYARRSPCRLFLCARTPEGLEDTVRACEQAGAEVYSASFDLCDRAALDSWLTHLRETAAPDIVVLNAGISACHMDADGVELAHGMRREMETNFFPAIEIVDGLLPVLKNKRSGARIVLISSIAALLPLPGWAGYCASKSALRVYGHAMRPLLKPHNIALTIILPGFVKTGLSDKLGGRKTMMTTPDDMAARIIRAVDAGRREFIYPRSLGWLAKAGWLLPVRVRDWILMRGFRFPMRDDAA